VILARVTGDNELEALALDKLHRDRDDTINGFGGTLAQAVAYWANQMVEGSPVGIPDLLELNKRRTC